MKSKARTAREWFRDAFSIDESQLDSVMQSLGDKPPTDQNMLNAVVQAGVLDSIAAKHRLDNFRGVVQPR